MPSRSLDFGEDAEMSLADALEALGVRLAAPNDGWDIAIDLDGGGQSLHSRCARSHRRARHGYASGWLQLEAGQPEA
jgi:hypothetical protein